MVKNMESFLGIIFIAAILIGIWECNSPDDPNSIMIRDTIGNIFQIILINLVFGIILFLINILW